MSWFKKLQNLLRKIKKDLFAHPYLENDWINLWGNFSSTKILINVKKKELNI